MACASALVVRWAEVVASRLTIAARAARRSAGGPEMMMSEG